MDIPINSLCGCLLSQSLDQLYGRPHTLGICHGQRVVSPIMEERELDSTTQLISVFVIGSLSNVHTLSRIGTKTLESMRYDRN